MSSTDMLLDSAATNNLAESSSSKDYSTTNIQVENVDEADIIKTDGNYIYSISGEDVIITNVQDEKNPIISSRIESVNGIPEEMIIYKENILVIILSDANYNSYSSNNNTIVNIYDTTDKTNPLLIKEYQINEPYYTSRCIDNKLYVISSGILRKEYEKIDRYYEEDNEQKEIKLNDIKYIKDIDTRYQTIISFVDLNNAKNEIKVSPYLIDISNAYISENYIYLLNQEYTYNTSVPPISSIFGIKGIIGAFTWDEYEENGYKTYIYKFKMQEDGEIKYVAKAKIQGTTINQYSLDEYEGNLRIALYDSKKGSRIAVLDENLKEIGTTSNLAKGEKMYSSRFIGEKAYLVTYKTVDPLYVIDLSTPTSPKVLGKLKIPGYSTYLHPYDDNYLIGIGMQTEESIRRDSSGRIISQTASITGMKMALFDVTDVSKPKEISSTVIGDSYSTSAILTNPKALLFSKEKGLIAIPVNNYTEKFEIQSSDSNDEVINYYKNYRKNYISEGYFVYSINPEDGINLKGTVVHDKKKTSGYSTSSRLLRGLYIENNLFTVSEDLMRINNLETMEQIAEINMTKEEN